MSTRLNYTELDNLIEKATEANPFLEGEISGLAARLLEIKSVTRRARCMLAFIDLLKALTS